ncbi:MAG: type I-U CRISPR-associated helicase/endonuclease Cas3, partial [Gemmataceae bacterium]|nr:type I-U CRISPR-associated helicase/endonuclease Cas3 [Gemmataceae bacterium]
RLGRVNRFGDREDTRVDVVCPESFGDSEPDPQRKATLEILRRLPSVGDGRFDASPQALNALKERSDLPCKLTDAFSPPPTMLDATDMLFDAWAMTTIRDKLPGRPPVAPFLHGVADWEPPETFVAWRNEVAFTDALLDRYDPVDLLEDYPLKPHELLRDRSDRVFDELQAIASREPMAPVWLVDEEGRVTTWKLGDLANPSATQAASRKPLIDRIAGATVLLPPQVGGLSHGMLDGASPFADDVADIDTPVTERRLRLWSDDENYNDRSQGMSLVRMIDLPGDADDDENRPTWDWFKQRPLEDARAAKRAVSWDVHVRDVMHKIDRIVDRLRLPKDIVQAVCLAAKFHDSGKRRAPFQFGLGNRAYPRVVLAKSSRAAARLPETYRHEFGSLADALNDREFQQLAPETQDLALHLIAAHHGRARPHFPAAEVFDAAPGAKRPHADIARDVPRRFARLQRTYGRWGLAYLESLLRAADWAASADPSEFVAENEGGLR